jgi:hypothetical protein
MKHHSKPFGAGSLARTLLAGVFVAACLIAWPATADELQKLGLPAFFGDEDDGYGIVIHKYTANSKGEYGKKQEIEHEIEFEGLIRPSDDDDIIGFRSTLRTVEARDEDGDDLYAGDERRKREKYSAVIPRPQYTSRRGGSMQMAFIELKECMLDKPGAFVDELELHALAIKAKDRESEVFPAVVADRFLDVGHNIAIQVTAMEVKAEGVMNVTLDVQRGGGKGDTIVDSLYALNEDGDVIGGGRWINELDIFAKECEYEMVLLLEGEVTISKFKVVLATKYEIVPVPFIIENLYQR